MLSKLTKFLSSLYLILSTSCVYHFTNKHISVPQGAKTIAIAPIFDSSRIVIAHDVLWNALQEAFATSGHLRLAPSAYADFFLQAHVKDGTRSQYESDAKNTITNPDMFINPTTNTPYELKDQNSGGYVNLHAADVYSKRERVHFTVLVEIWDLRNKTLLLKKEYPLSTNFDMLAILTTKESNYIRNEETNELLLNTAAKNFSRDVVNDLFSTPAFTLKNAPF